MTGSSKDLMPTSRSLDEAISTLLGRLSAGAHQESIRDEFEPLIERLELRIDLLERAMLVSRDLIIHESLAMVNFPADSKPSLERTLTLPDATLFVSDQADFLIANEDVGLIAYLVRHGLDIEPSVRAILTALVQEGDVAIDIGANYGLHTIPLGAQVGPKGLVIAAEPHPLCFHFLVQNIRLNGFERRMRAVQAAVSSESGVGTLYAAQHSPLSSLFSSPAGTEADPVTCEIVTVDDLTQNLAGPLRIVKLDMEGSEPLAWEGSKLTRAKFPNASFILEWSSENLAAAGSSRASLFKSITREDYRVFGIVGRDLIEMRDSERVDAALESIFVSRDENAIHRARMVLDTSGDR